MFSPETVLNQSINILFLSKETPRRPGGPSSHPRSVAMPAPNGPLPGHDHLGGPEVHGREEGVRPEKDSAGVQRLSGGAMLTHRAVYSSRSLVLDS